jgi:uncharacterized membrane protein YccC
MNLRAASPPRDPRNSAERFRPSHLLKDFQRLISTPELTSTEYGMVQQQPLWIARVGAQAPG